MASIVLKSVGAAIGNAIIPGFGAFFGGALGSIGGGMIDQNLGLGAHVTGPRLDSLNVQDSRYGTGIPVIYGTARVAGNVIWSTDLIQTTHKNGVGGGKGGGLGGGTSATTYSYSVHCAVGIAAGPIGGIGTIWADSKVIYQNGVWTSGVVDAATIYTGGASQAPDPFMQSILGAGNVPAYRGLAYIVLENLQLAGFGNRLPNLTFEIIPGITSSNPAWLNSVDAGISQLSYTQQNGGMPPITLSGSGGETSTVLLGGFVQTGATSVFEVAAYDVTGNVPIQLQRVQSASFSTPSSIVDSSWALSPDGRFVAMYLQSSGGISNQFVIYDTVNAQFGAVYGVNIPILTTMKQIGWIDPQHFVIDDTTGGARGVHVFGRAGLGLIDLGTWNVWGAGSAASRLPLGYAQYTPSAGGLLSYMTDSATPYFTTIYARQLTWGNNALTVGAAYVVASGLTPTNSGNGHANLIQTASGEWTLCFATFPTIQLISFMPTPASASITRPWQTLTPSIGSSTTSFPIFYGDRLVVVQGSTGANTYQLSEIMLNTGSFSLSLDSILIANTPPHTLGFSAVALDMSRFLLMGVGGYGSDMSQCAIVQRCPSGSGLDTIVSDLLTRAGYASGDFDVTQLAGNSVFGYILADPMSARAAIEPLQVYAPFDLVETSGQLKAVTRHANANATITFNEWRAAQERKAPPPALDISRAQELDLPREIGVDYIDVARNFEVNSQRARRAVTRAQSVQKINLPIVCSASTAKAVAETRLFAVWAERDLVRLTVSRTWLAVDPGDVINLGNGSLLRVTKINQAGGWLQMEGFYVNTAAYSSAATGDVGLGIARAATAVTPASQLYLLDTPLLQGTDDQPGVYAAATGLPGWTGASLWRAADGVNYSQVAALPTPATTGIAVTALGNGSGLYPDNANSVNVQVINGTLSSCGTADLYNGVNAALLGGEIIQFQTATLIGPGLYTLGNLLRGRRGTESATGTHALGENFVLLAAGAVEFVPALLNDRGATYEFRALSNGQSLGSASDTNFTYGLGTIQPFAPVNIQGARASGTGSDLTLTWKRRARLNAEWVSYVDVPLDELAELYDVEIMNGVNVMRTFSAVTAPTATYTAAQQGSDWGSVPSSFTVNVYQISARYGRGKQGTATV